MKAVQLWTDGGIHPNPGPGAWAYVLIFGDVVKEASGFVGETTNNRLELQAVIEGLNALNQPCAVTIYSDSQWVVNCAQRLWRRKTNTDLWALFDRAAARHTLTWQWVKGHAGNPWNERCDQLAAEARRAGKLEKTS